MHPLNLSEQFSALLNVNEPSFEILLPAIRILLANKIQKAVSEVCKIPVSEQPALNRAECRCLNLINDINVATPLRRVKNITRVWYVSAIAFQAAGGQQQNPLDIAQSIALKLFESERDEQGTGLDLNDRNNVTANTSRSIITSHFLSKIWINSTIWVAFPGWIYWQISDVGLAAWFQTILCTDLSLNFAGQPRATHNTSQASVAIADLPFSIFYTHARCCSLLRAAHRQGWIELSHSSDTGMTISSPYSGAAFGACFALNHPAERELAMALIDALDEVSLKPTHLATLKRQAQHVSDRFQVFQAQCPLQADENRAVRLGLVSATQRVLRLILENGLGITAPRSL